MILDSYKRPARGYPALLTAIPIIILFNLILKDEPIFDSLLGISVSNLTAVTASLYLLIQINRTLSMALFEPQPLEMPTVKFLLFTNDHFSTNHKNKIRDKVFQDYGISLPSKDEEDQNVLEAKKRIREATTMIKETLGRGKMLFQMNIEYGFIRNLLGGSIVALIVNCFLIYYTYVNNLNIIFIFSIVYGSLPAILLLFNRYLTRTFSHRYADRFYSEYLTLNEP